MLDLNAMRAEFAAYLTDNFHKSKSLDAALMHVLTRAYEQGQEDAQEPEINVPVLPPHDYEIAA